MTFNLHLQLLLAGATRDLAVQIMHHHELKLLVSPQKAPHWQKLITVFNTWSTCCSIYCIVSNSSILCLDSIHFREQEESVNR